MDGAVEFDNTVTPCLLMQTVNVLRDERLHRTVALGSMQDPSGGRPMGNEFECKQCVFEFALSGVCVCVCVCVCVGVCMCVCVCP